MAKKQQDQVKTTQPEQKISQGTKNPEPKKPPVTKKTAPKNKQTPKANTPKSGNTKTESAQKASLKSSKRKPHATRPTEPEKEIIRRRRETVLQMRLLGYTFRQISKQLELQKFERCSPATCVEDYKYMLDLANEAEKMTAEQMVEEACLHLEKVRTSFYPSLKRTIQSHLSRMEKKDAADTIINCTKEIAKLRNIYKPIKIEITDDREFAEELGIPLEELPDEDDSDDGDNDN